MTWMKPVVFGLFWLLVCATAQCADELSSGLFRVVFIDSATEGIYGQFPLDRRIVARVIDQVRLAGAKAVVLKFFYDLPKSKESDEALAKAIGGIPCAVQACIRRGESNSNTLPEKFSWPNRPGNLIDGNSGWIPLPNFSVCARAVGFVDFTRTDSVPLIERYQGRTVKSLYLCALEFATGAQADFDKADRVILGSRWIGMNEDGQHPIRFPDADKIDYIPFHEVLAAKPADVRATFQGTVVILGYDGTKIDRIGTKIGEMGAHRLFVHQLDALCQDLKTEK
jgi:hypothetical protein